VTELTANRLRHLLTYDPVTGVFRWLNPTNRRLRCGAVAGTPHNRGYTSISLDGVQYLAHRLAWLHVHGHWPPGDLDHRDRDKRNNRIANLRPATRGENVANTPVRRNSASGVKGVERVGKRWRAKIRRDGVTTHIGTFDTDDEAARAFEDAAVVADLAKARQTLGLDA